MNYQLAVTCNKTGHLHTLSHPIIEVNLNIVILYFIPVGYTMDTITYQWMESAVEFDPDITLPQYTLVNNTLEDCSQNYTTGKLVAFILMTSAIIH